MPFQSNPILAKFPAESPSSGLKNMEPKWEKTDQPLYYHLDCRTNVLLAMAGLSQAYKLLPKGNIFSILCRFRNCVLLLLAFVCYFVLTAYFLMLALNSADKFLDAFLVIGIPIQGISLGYATYHLTERINSPTEILELPHYKEVFPFTIGILIVFLLTALPIILYDYPAEVGVWNYLFTSYIVLASLLQSFLFAANLFFILVDVQCSKQLILFAIELQNSGQLKLSFINKIRDEINQRVQRSALPNNCLMVVAIYYSVFILAAFLFFDNSFSFRLSRAAVVSIMFREIFFLIVSFWETAKVNEIANTLVLRLSRDIVVLAPAFQQLTNQIDQSNSKKQPTESNNDDLENGLSLRSDEVTDHLHRLMIFMNVSGDPLSFRLAGMRLTRQDILLRFGLWVVGIVIGIGKS
jgi:hypothetical protein